VCVVREFTAVDFFDGDGESVFVGGAAEGVGATNFIAVYTGAKGEVLSWEILKLIFQIIRYVEG
jgi:hypothetical protein